MITFFERMKQFSFFFTFLFLFFTVVNIFSYLFLQYAQGKNTLFSKYDINDIVQAYPKLEKKIIQGILNENWGRPTIYSSYVQFREQQHVGSYVNISQHGFRLNETLRINPFPIKAEPLNIFVFGGSTTFSYGVRDHETIPAYLETFFRNDDVNANVYNFGRAFYFSSQERALFEKLIMSGNVPDLAIFIDGLNDFYRDDGEPVFTGLLNGKMEHSFYYAQKKFFRELPFVNLARFCRDSISRTAQNNEDSFLTVIKPDEKVVEQVLKRYLLETRMIKALSKEFKVKSFFVWQPIPEYGMDLTTHPFYGDGKDLQTAANLRKGYQLAKQLFEKHLPEIIWSAELTKICRGNFVDKVHYSANFNKNIAKYIYNHLLPNISKGAHHIGGSS